MNPYQTLANRFNEWTIYLWTRLQVLDQETDQIQRQLNSYQTDYQTWLQVQEKVDHYLKLRQKGGIVPPHYHKQLLQTLSATVSSGCFLPMNQTEQIESRILPQEWLFDLTIFENPLMVHQWILYCRWNWIYHFFYYLESKQTTIKDLKKQLRAYEVVLSTQRIDWFKDRIQHLSQSH